MRKHDGRCCSYTFPRFTTMFDFWYIRTAKPMEGASNYLGSISQASVEWLGRRNVILEDTVTPNPAGFCATSFSRYITIPRHRSTSRQHLADISRRFADMQTTFRVDSRRRFNATGSHLSGISSRSRRHYWPSQGR